MECHHISQQQQADDSEMRPIPRRPSPPPPPVETPAEEPPEEPERPNSTPGITERSPQMIIDYLLLAVFQLLHDRAVLRNTRSEIRRIVAEAQQTSNRLSVSQTNALRHLLAPESSQAELFQFAEHDLIVDALYSAELISTEIHRYLRAPGQQVLDAHVIHFSKRMLALASGGRSLIPAEINDAIERLLQSRIDAALTVADGGCGGSGDHSRPVIEDVPTGDQNAAEQHPTVCVMPLCAPPNDLGGHPKASRFVQTDGQPDVVLPLRSSTTSRIRVVPSKVAPETPEARELLDSIRLANEKRKRFRLERGDHSEIESIIQESSGSGGPSRRSSTSTLQEGSVISEVIKDIVKLCANNTATEREIICPFCTTEREERPKLTIKPFMVHYINEHAERNELGQIDWKCHECEKYFKSRDTFVNHAKESRCFHRTEVCRQFMCPICEDVIRFKRSDHLEQHLIRLHSDEVKRGMLTTVDEEEEGHSEDANNNPVEPAAKDGPSTSFSSSKVLEAISLLKKAHGLKKYRDRLLDDGDDETEQEEEDDEEGHEADSESVDSTFRTNKRNEPCTSRQLTNVTSSKRRKRTRVVVDSEDENSDNEEAPLPRKSTRILTRQTNTDTPENTHQTTSITQRQRTVFIRSFDQGKSGTPNGPLTAANSVATAAPENEPTTTTTPRPNKRPMSRATREAMMRREAAQEENDENGSTSSKKSTKKTPNKKSRRQTDEDDYDSMDSDTTPTVR